MPKKQPSQEFEVDEQEVQPDNQIFNNIYQFPQGRHLWRQQGPYCICRNCELHHAIYIGMDKIMVGEDEEGRPIIKSKQEVFGNK